MWRPESNPADEWEGRIAENEVDSLEIHDKIERYQQLSLRSACGVKTTARRVGSASTQTMQRKHFPTSVPGTIGRMEIDNRADTTVFGANMTAIAFTGQTCDVQPFKETMPPERDVPIASAATAYDDPDTGETTILEFNQGLWFGDTMQHSLVNPNQCRIIGIDLCDDPFDKYRKLGINDYSTGLTVPLEFSHCAIGVTTRAPTYDEIENARSVGRLIEMTSEAPWDPSAISIGSASITMLHDELTDQRTQKFDKEFDRLLMSCSAIYTEKALLQRLERKVRVASELDNIVSKATVATRLTSVNGIISNERHSSIKAEDLARRWNIGIEAAQATLKATTQHGVRHAIHPLTRRYRTDILQARLRQLNDKFYTDTLFGSVKTINGNTCGQIFTNGKFVHFEPMKRKSEAGTALIDFTHDVGVPRKLVFDGAKEQVGPQTEFMKCVRRNHIDWRATEPYSHWQNQAEGMIREIRKDWRRARTKHNIPRRLWDYGMAHTCKIRQMTARGPDWRTPYEEITGETPDISEWIDFDLYDWVWYWDQPGNEDNPKIGRWLGVSHRIGASMCYWVLTGNGKVLSRSTVQNMPRVDRLKEENRKIMDNFTTEIEKVLSEDVGHVETDVVNPFYIDDVDDDVEPMEKWEEDADTYATPDTFDEYIGTKVMLPQGDGKIKGR